VRRVQGLFDVETCLDSCCKGRGELHPDSVSNQELDYLLLRSLLILQACTSSRDDQLRSALCGHAHYSQFSILQFFSGFL